MGCLIDVFYIQRFENVKFITAETFPVIVFLQNVCIKTGPILGRFLFVHSQPCFDVTVFNFAIISDAPAKSFGNTAIFFNNRVIGIVNSFNPKTESPLFKRDSVPVNIPVVLGGPYRLFTAVMDSFQKFIDRIVIEIIMIR